MIFIKGKEPKPLACIQDLAPSETNDSPKAKESPKVNGFVSKICKEAAYERVKALDYFSSSKPSKRNGPILVDACEPKSHWKLSVNASAPATNIRKAMGSASWSHKNLFGGFWGLTGCVAISPHSLKDIQGEVSCSKKVFLGGGRERLSKWLSANKNEFCK